MPLFRLMQPPASFFFKVTKCDRRSLKSLPFCRSIRASLMQEQFEPG